MQFKTSQVRVALNQCHAWYADRGEDIRQMTERTEELWFEIDALVGVLHKAEQRGDTLKASLCVKELLCYTAAIFQEVQVVRSRHRG